MPRLPIFLGLLLACTSPAAAPDCDSPNATQADLTECARGLYTAADADLNLAYETLRTSLTHAEQDALRTAQRAWLNFRDLECSFVAAKFAGGSAEPMEHYGCLRQLSEQRTAQLHAEHQSRNPTAR